MYILKILKYGYRIMKISWKANGAYSIISPLGLIYVSTIFPLVQIFVLTRAIDLLTHIDAFTLSKLSPFLSVYILFYLIRIILDTFVSSKVFIYDMRLGDYLDMIVNQKLAQLDPATFESSQFQDLLSQMRGLSGAFYNFNMSFFGMIDSLIKIISSSILLIVSFPIFIPIIMFATIPYYIASNARREAIWPYFWEKRSPLIRLVWYVMGLMSQEANSKETAIYKTGNVLLSKSKHAVNTYFRNFFSVLNRGDVKILTGSLIQFVAFIYTQVLNLGAVLSGKLSIGNFGLYFQQTLNLAEGSEKLLENYSSIGMRLKYLDKFFQFFEIKPKIASPSEPMPIPNSPFPARIEFKDVSFRYPKTEKYILRNFNLTINSGEKIALVGENGAGKSTIIKLLLRFHDVTEGEVLINGVNIKGIDLDEWHKQIGALFQDYIRYQFMVKENVYYGNLKNNHNRELLYKSVERSGAKQFIEELPQKYDQVVGKMFDGGVDLSGGQWQKLALARAYFRDAPFLILDEPTAAIDAKAEYEIFQKVNELQKNKTVIIISHRFSTVRNADRILVLNEGRIIEEGSHEKLMKEKGLYAELFNIQAQGYK